MSRCGSGGVLWGLSGGLAIGLPPVLKFGSEELKERIVPDCLAGRKVICLAITEPWGGSDVANIHCTAEKTPDGKHYIVNGIFISGLPNDFLQVRKSGSPTVFLQTTSQSP